MAQIINIAIIQNRRIKTQKLEFDNDKECYTIKAYDNYDRAKAKKLTERLIKEYER